MMTDSFTSDFKRFFSRGLAILLPTAVTLWLLVQAFGFVFNNVAQPINRATRFAVIWVVPRVLDEDKIPEWFQVTDDRVLDIRASRDIRESVSDESVRLDLRKEYLAQFWLDHRYL
ncbi:MAG: hypothetical protein JKX70_01060, partial [Phycisphaerales bacterium]|nr:hypothetical protein [Phycisphaerales bacterium]